MDVTGLPLQPFNKSLCYLPLCIWFILLSTFLLPLCFSHIPNSPPHQTTSLLCLKVTISEDSPLPVLTLQHVNTLQLGPHHFVRGLNTFFGTIKYTYHCYLKCDSEDLWHLLPEIVFKNPESQLGAGENAVIWEDWGRRSGQPELHSETCFNKTKNKIMTFTPDLYQNYHLKRLLGNLCAH